MALSEKRYLYRGRVLQVWQYMSDLKYGIVSSDAKIVSPRRPVMNKDLGRYDDHDEAQAALDAFAKKKGLSEI